MNNNDILNELHSNGEGCIPSERLDPDFIEKSLSNVHRRNNKKVACLCVSLGVVCLTVIGVGITMFNQPSLPIKTDTTQASSYDDIYKVVKSVKKEMEGTLWDKIEANLFGYEMDITDIAGDSSFTNKFTMSESDSVESLAESTSGESSEYSETNNQVEGVDEADIVKTDGEYIYSVSQQEIFITKANNGNPVNISSIVCDYAVSEIYIHDDKLVALSSAYPDSSTYINGTDTEEHNYYYDTPLTGAYIYDLSDINNPTEISALSQSGNYLSSRKIDNVIYLTTRYSIYDYETIDEATPETYCPVYGTNTDIKCIDPKNIVISKNVSDIEYVTVSSINLDNTEDFADMCSVLGSSSEIYSSLNNLYVASYIYDDEGDYTEIMRFSLNDTEITPNGSLTVDGALLNQFSMDEYKGFFRVVTEITSYDEVYNDNDEVFAIGSSENTKTALYVYDTNLTLAGKTEDVANGEHIKSVRFDGDIAYFVTFRQTDPLFTVDLSDPYSPEILSELKIPGFSEYLHIFGDGLLLGFGREADTSTGLQEGLKLSMFDTSDKTNVTELATRIFTDSNAYSVAEYDHRAIFVDEEKSIIGIPYRIYVDDGIEGYYAIFKYDAELKDFILCQKIKTYGYHDYNYYESQNTRGIYIGDYFYIVTPEKIYTLDYNTFEEKGYIYTDQYFN